MSNFRFISYLYEYKKEQKGRNTGFVRVRGLNDFIELNMQIKPAKGSYEIYVHYETLPEVKSILVGTIRAVNGECHGVFHNILPILRKEGLSFSAIEALTIWQDGAICHGTEWSESKCLNRLLSGYDRKQENQGWLQTSEKEMEVEEIGAEEGREEDIEESKGRAENKERKESIVSEESKDVEESKDIEERKNIEDSKNIEESKERENRNITEERREGKEREVKENRGKAEKGWEKNFVKEPEENLTLQEKAEDTEIKPDSSKDVNRLIDEIVNAGEETECFFVSGWPKPKTIEELMLQLKTIPSFGNESFLKCVKIMPKDIGLLNADDWYLGKNSFLLHGYFAYQYLMLGYIRFQDGGKQAVLGVPGVYNSKDKYLAELFGFTNFIQAKQQEIKTGTFGYWITSVHENIS